MERWLWQFAAAVLMLAQTVAAQQPQPAGNFYRDQMKPLLERACLACHNPKLRQGGLDLSTREALLKGSVHGPVTVPGNPDDSQLYKVVARVVEPGMPFKGAKLAAADVARFAEWIRGGLSYGEESAAGETVDLTEVRKHWAFRKPVRPSVPANGQANPIDAFLTGARRRQKLEALPAANPSALLRRVYLDLTGLPPTPEQLAAFTASRDPRVYEKAVDELLESPRHGERWGRHWLDIWRYSDWYGYRKSDQVRYSQRHIWRWRDWTVEALNRNKPYDRMILEMIAGDEAAPGDPDVARATGYLARNWYMFNRNVWLGDITEYTSTAFLGLTLKCARCHSHKYDPIPQADYYRFRAFFEPHEVRTDRVPGEADVRKDGLPRVFDADESRPTYRFIRGNENSPDTAVQLTPGVPALFGQPELGIRPVALPPAAYFPDSRPFVPPSLIAAARATLEQAKTKLEKARQKPEPEALIAAAVKRVEAARAAIPALEARIHADLAANETPVPAGIEQLGAEARRLERAANQIAADAELIQARYEFDLGAKDEKKFAAATGRLEAALKALKEPAEGYTPIGEKYPVSSTGRRLALARWMGSRDNPLTARVAINHMWLRHFGTPLVSTVFNFGRNGKPASHPELLDWLAVEFMESGWNMKAMHRLMVNSQAYRLASSAGAAAMPPQQKIDPDNTYLWRANLKRMEAEVVRDSMLALAGKLDTAMGGAEIEETRGNEVYRRSLYFRHTPDLQMDMLQVFDPASPIECFARSESIVPQQALALSNGALGLEMARVIAGDLAGQAPSPDAFASAAFYRLLGRAPTPAERSESIGYLASQAELYRDPAKLTSFQTGAEPARRASTDPDRRARESLVHVLFNHNDFVTIR